MKNLIATLLENARALALLLGVALLILADLRKVSIGTFQLDLSGSTAARIGFFSIGTLLVLVFSLSILLKGGRTSISKRLAIRRAGIAITFPKDNQPIAGEFSAEGTFKRKPAERDVRVFVASTHDERLWPQGAVVFNEKTRTWSCRVNLWDHPKPDAYLFVAELGEDSRILCDYYGRVGDTVGWVPIRQLPSDSIEYDRVRVQNNFVRVGAA